MLRLSVVYREPLHKVKEWPARDIKLLATFLGREPAPEIRIEQGIAQVCALIVNSMRAKETQPAKLSDFLLYRDAFKPPVIETEDRYSEADKLMLAAIDGIGKP